MKPIDFKKKNTQRAFLLSGVRLISLKGIQSEYSKASSTECLLFGRVLSLFLGYSQCILKPRQQGVYFGVGAYPSAGDTVSVF